MKLAFFSSSPLALPLLEKLQRDFEVVLTVTAKKRLDADFAQKIKDLQIDLAVVIDFGLLIPKIVYQAPKLQTINIHFSLLPLYRGPYPDAFVILNNEKKTGISYVLIDEGFDTGDILAQQEVEVLPDETAGILHQRLYQEVVKNISYIINTWAGWKMSNNSKQITDNSKQISLYLPPKKQSHKLATYTKLLGREDGYVSGKILSEVLYNKEIVFDEFPDLIKKYGKQNFFTKSKIKNRNAKIIFNFYRALSPWPGMWTIFPVIPAQAGIYHMDSHFHGNDKIEKRLKILGCHLEDKKFVIDQVQLEGKNPVSWKQFCEGYKIL